MKTFSMAVILLAALMGVAAADNGFPFGAEMMLDAQPQRGSKRLPNLEIGDDGAVVLQLWCKAGKGQFSVAGDTVVFIAGALDDGACSPALAQLDDALLATLADATGWNRRGDVVSFIGAKTLRFRINTN